MMSCVVQELWSALRALMANSDGDDDLPREIPGDSRYHHPDEIDIILGFVENKLRLFEQRYDR